jgi:hypothetical protein
MKNGNIITKTPLMKLLELKNEAPDSEFNSLFHLTERHLSVDKAERMNVRLAAQTLLRSVAVALTRYLPHDPEAQELAIFIRNKNDWFDILNSHNTLPTVPLKKPFSNTIDVDASPKNLQPCLPGKSDKHDWQPQLYVKRLSKI